MTSGQIQMSVFSLALGALGIASFVYVAVTQPAYLQASREGVPHLTPTVINPADGQALDLNVLVRHYKGETQ